MKCFIGVMLILIPLMYFIYLDCVGNQEDRAFRNGVVNWEVEVIGNCECVILAFCLPFVGIALVFDPPLHNKKRKSSS